MSLWSLEKEFRYTLSVTKPSTLAALPFFFAVPQLYPSKIDPSLLSLPPPPPPLPPSNLPLAASPVSNAPPSVSPSCSSSPWNELPPICSLPLNIKRVLPNSLSLSVQSSTSSSSSSPASVLCSSSNQHPPSPPPPPPSHFICLTLVDNASLSRLHNSLRKFGTYNDDNQKLGAWKLYDSTSGLKTFNARFMFFGHIQQSGPQCGFAALAMIASSVGKFYTPDYLVSEAKMLDITNNGEMFSADWLTDFASYLLSQHFEVTMFSNSISGYSELFKQYIHEDSLVMIPYDADFNHQPFMKSGHRAHWAIICGYVDGGSEENFYVIARHGKSAHPTVWKFTDLLNSNDNLLELAPKRQTDSLVYKVPKGGVKEGLCSKWILFKRKYF